MDETRHRLIVGDSQAMPSIPDGTIDLVVTSPPYPMIEMWDSLFSSRNPGVAKALDDLDGPDAFRLMHRDLDMVWSEIARVLKPGGWACVNIGDATRKIGERFQLYPNHALVTERFLSLGFDILPLILWRKQTNAPNKFMGSGMLPAGAYVTLEHEYILIMRKGAKREFASGLQRLARRTSAFFWEERNTWFSDIWDFKGTRQTLEHPDLRARSAAFPLELPYRLINMYSVRGDTVLDPFVGTGTTTFAAMASGRHSIGIEVDPSLVNTITGSCAALTPLLNRRIADRIRDHLSFVETCRENRRELKHSNQPHGFPVMTLQETDLELRFIAEIRPVAGNELAVTYRGEPADATVTGLDVKSLGSTLRRG
jgi:DNA modification methylase